MSRFSIIIPIFNAQETLKLCLDSVAQQIFEDFELILVDNYSTDHSPLIIQDWCTQNHTIATHVLEEQFRGPGACRNRGAKTATGDYLCFIDSDCVADIMWLNEINLYLKDHPDTSAVAGQIAGFSPRSTLQKFQSLFTLKTNAISTIQNEYTLTNGGFASANLVIRRTLFQDIGGFDPTMRWGEDHELCHRIYQAQHTIHYTPRAIVFHQHRTALVEMIRQSIGFGTAHADLLKRHPRRIVEFPFWTFNRTTAATPFWLSFKPIDKKIFLLFILTIGFPNLALIWLFFTLTVFFQTYTQISEQLSDELFPMSPIEKIQAIGLLIIKSSAMTWGRIQGTLRHKVWCL